MKAQVEKELKNMDSSQAKVSELEVCLLSTKDTDSLVEKSRHTVFVNVTLSRKEALKTSQLFVLSALTIDNY